MDFSQNNILTNLLGLFFKGGGTFLFKTESLGHLDPLHHGFGYVCHV